MVEPYDRDLEMIRDVDERRERYEKDDDRK